MVEVGVGVGVVVGVVVVVEVVVEVEGLTGAHDESQRHSISDVDYIQLHLFWC